MHKLTMPLANFKVLELFPSSNDLLKGLDPPELSSVQVLRKTLMRTPCGNLQTLPSAEFPLTMCTPAATVSQHFTHVHNLGTSLSMCTPCMAPMPKCTSTKMRTKETLSEPFVNALLAGILV
jgi:hypothetical protein